MWMRVSSSYRMRRVNEAIREIIGVALARELKDPRIGFVTLTGVDTAPDLSHAKVYYSVYGKQAEKNATLEGLVAARAYLQKRIGDELHLKRTPSLEFTYDTTVDQGMRIDALLRSSQRGSSQEAEPKESGDQAAEAKQGDS
jgi:ribosome-binding factor A